MLVITLLSVAVAVVMSVIAWRLVREERRRSDARVAALSSDIFSTDQSPAPVPVSELFEPDARPRTRARLVNALAIGLLVVGGAIGLTVAFSGDGPSTAAASAAPGAGGADAAGAADAAGPALELTALGHERHGDQLTVRGLIRNRGAARYAAPLIAMVSVFDRQGELVASALGTVDRAALEAGVESRFVVHVAGLADVYRYRVSFTLDDRTVPHVDRRADTVKAQLP